MDNKRNAYHYVRECVDELCLNPTRYHDKDACAYTVALEWPTEGNSDDDVDTSATDDNINTQADSVNISLERIADALTAIADHLTRTMVRG
jgi:hypothetical protein